MKTKLFSVLAGCTLALMILGQSYTGDATAQDKEKKKAGEKKSKKAKGRKKARGRLPNYYGKIGLSGEQRKEIYSIQGKYREQMQPLQKQLRDLRAKQEKEIQTVLTDGQKDELKKLLDEARKKQSSRKKKGKAKPKKSKDGDT